MTAAQFAIDNPPLFLAGVFVFGLLIGSFLNVVILRMPARLFYDWRCQCEELLELSSDSEEPPPPPGFATARSQCPSCGHKIRAYENIPVVSYVFLRGKCSGCGVQISFRYPAVELLTALLFLTVAWVFGPSIQFLAALVLTAFLVVLAGIDIDHQLLPDNMTLLLLWAGLLLNVNGTFVPLTDAVFGAALGYLSLWSVFQLFKLLTGKEGMGYGDFKLLAALGAWMGWQSILLIIILSSLVGAIFGVLMLITRKTGRDQPIPFGPYIAAAGWINLIWGDVIIKTYLRSSGMY